MISTSVSRRGAILIIAAGLAAMIAGLALTFLVHTRHEAEESTSSYRYAQARIMLHAGLAYIQEGARIGWDTQLGDSVNMEGFGWVDIRGGVRDLDRFAARYGRAPTASEALSFPIGPRSQQDVVLLDGSDGDDGIWDALWDVTLVEDGDGDGVADRPAWPAIGSVARCPIYRMERPPFAIAATVAPNAIINDPMDPHFGLPLLRRRDPEPAFGPGVGPTSAVGPRWDDWSRGDRRPVPGTESRAWFRVHRDGPATFVITCGSGATQGFRDYDEVVGAGATAEFQGSESLFNEILAMEIRLWYRVEWSPATGDNFPTRVTNDTAKLSQASASVATNHQQFPWAKSANHGGTFAFIQRLQAPPEVW